jgi:hypothetical protein
MPPLSDDGVLNSVDLEPALQLSASFLLGSTRCGDRAQLDIDPKNSAAQGLHRLQRELLNRMNAARSWSVAIQNEWPTASPGDPYPAIIYF